MTGLGLPSLAVTIGTMALFRGLAYVILGDESVTSFPTGYTDWAFGTFAGTVVPNPIVLFIVLAIVFALLLHRTPFGRSVFAIGANKQAARFSGIRVDRIQLRLFILSGVIAALAGIILTLRNSTAAANVGTGFELTAIAAVVLGGVSIFGGTGTVGGVILGLILLGGIRGPQPQPGHQHLLGADRHGHLARRLRPGAEHRRSRPRGAAGQQHPRWTALRPGRPAVSMTGSGGEGTTNA